jgi:AcrR family transcriptional regulator
MHFEDKDALLVAVCAEHFAKLDEVSEAAVFGVRDPVARIERRGRAYINFGLENPEPYRIMFMTKTASSLRMTEDELADMAAFNHLREDVEAAMASGKIPKGDSFAIGCGLWAMVHGITSLLIAKPNFPWPPLEEFIAAALAAASVKNRK